MLSHSYLKLLLLFVQPSFPLLHLILQLVYVCVLHLDDLVETLNLVHLLFDLLLKSIFLQPHFVDFLFQLQLSVVKIC